LAFLFGLSAFLSFFVSLVVTMFYEHSRGAPFYGLGQALPALGSLYIQPLFI
jgi:hypothetical protein